MRRRISWLTKTKIKVRAGFSATKDKRIAFIANVPVKRQDRITER